jgi:2-keto-4-pentenoate hydratase/2-oxohepta-3-ene-1,7-dioic acid hydratase in catechol pathway
MKIARIRTLGGSDFAVQAANNTWVPLGSIGIDATTTAELIGQAGDAIAGISGRSGGIAEPEFLAPIVRPSKMLAIGLNYMDHIRETNATRPDNPIVFAKFPSAINDPDGQIVMDARLTEQGDYESELAVVIGRPTRGIPQSEALSCVFGYTVANDVSARDWQRADGQFDRSKGFDTFCPIGPWITTADEVPDPQNLAVRSWVNGEPRQDSSTREMIYSVEYLIWYIARGMTLEPGDVILTGTPHGVGFAMDPPRYVVPGDVVECEVEGLGMLRNAVVAPAP